jgi:hypothetical protein
MTIALSHTGKSLLVGTSKGTLRSYTFPLTKSDDYTEYVGHAGTINRVNLMYKINSLLKFLFFYLVTYNISR